MERVLGIGGYFLRATDPAALGDWYRDCLGLEATPTACGSPAEPAALRHWVTRL